MSDEKFEFCSQAWVDYAREYLLHAAQGADLDQISVTFNEVFTGVPAHLDPDHQGRTGWYLRVQDGTLDVARDVLDAADLRITADYATVVPLARMVFAANPALVQEAQRQVQAAISAGKMCREGDDNAMAALPWAAGLHDALAARTA